jgi:MFS family permease
MTIFMGSCIMLVGVAIQTAAQNIGMFIAARGIIGFGLGFACAAAPLLITELAFPTHRGPLTSLYNSSWYLGSIVAAWATYGTFRINNDWSWRIPSLLQGLPSILQVSRVTTT